MADAADLKSAAPRGACGFESHPRQFLKLRKKRVSAETDFVPLTRLRNSVGTTTTLPLTLVREIGKRP
jgi:hypothetical protein